MNFENEKVRWNYFCSYNKNFKKQFKKIEKVSLEEVNFFDDLNVGDDAIYGQYGIGYNKINIITFKKIIDVFLRVIEYNDSNEHVLISSDGSSECKEIIQNVIRFDSDIKYLAFSNYEGFDRNFVLSTIKKINPKCSFHLSKSIYKKDFININIYDENGIKIKNEFLEKLINKLDKNIDDLELTNDYSISFLNSELLIKIYVEKIYSLFNKTNNIRKTKIALSNRSNGIIQILTKLLGSQDFSYIVNNNIQNKNINLNSLKFASHKTLKRYFWKDILFAIKEKANFLICFNQEGSQMFLFSIYKGRVVYLDSDLISLIFLNNFYNELSINFQKLSSVFVSSNNKPNSNMNKLIHKYKIPFKTITNNNFLVDNFLLYFWNDYNQFVFGEKINQEFSIYHLIIKIVSIINYYNVQYGSIYKLLDVLKKMYGSFDIKERFAINIDEDEFKNKFINLWPDLVWDATVINSDKNISENQLWEIKIDNNITWNVKFNKINNKIFLNSYRLRTNNFWKEIKIKNDIRRWIRKIKS